MTLATARASERRRRFASFLAGTALAFAGVACAAATCVAASHVHRAAVRMEFGFDIHRSDDWRRLEAQWRAGRFALDTPRRLAFAASLAAGGIATGALTLLAALRLPPAFSRGLALLAQRRARAAAAIAIPKAAAIAATPAATTAAGTAAAPPQAAAAAPGAGAAKLAEAASNLPEERRRLLEGEVAASDAHFARSRERIIEETPREIADLAGAVAREAIDGAAPAAAGAPHDSGEEERERALAVVRIRRDAAAVEARVFDGAAFGCNIAVLAGRTLVLASVFVQPGDWVASDTDSDRTWRDGDVEIDSPAYAAALAAHEAFERLGERVSTHALDVRAVLCLAGRASLMNAGDGAIWQDYRIEVADASVDESAGTGIDTIATLLRECAVEPCANEACDALAAFADIDAKASA